jgi:predicted PurR-regulated permease PerM
MPTPIAERTQHAWFLALLGAVTIAFFWLTLDFLQPLFWAAVMAILFHPVFRLLDLRLRGKGRAALATTLVIILLVFTPLALIGVAVSREALSLYNVIRNEVVVDGEMDLPGFLARVQPMVEDLATRVGLDLEQLVGGAADAAGTAAQLLASQAVIVGQNVLNAIAKTALMIYLLFFFLRDGEVVLAAIVKAIPLGESRQRALFSRFASVTRATLKGTLVVGAVQGALGGVLFALLGINAPVLWGVVMTMASLLPLAGPALIWGPWAVYLIATGSIAKGIILAAGGTLLVGTADNILRPILVGRETRMPDYLVLLSTLGGLSVFGLSGFVAGPVVAALFLSVWDMFAREHTPDVTPDPLPKP